MSETEPTTISELAAQASPQDRDRAEHDYRWDVRNGSVRSVADATRWAMEHSRTGLSDQAAYWAVYAMAVDRTMTNDETGPEDADEDEEDAIYTGEEGTP